MYSLIFTHVPNEVMFVSFNSSKFLSDSFLIAVDWVSHEQVVLILAFSFHV